MNILSPYGTDLSKALTRADAVNERDASVASDMRRLIRSKASELRTELMTLCKELSLGNVDQAEAMILKYFGPEDSVMEEAALEVTHGIGF